MSRLPTSNNERGLTMSLSSVLAKAAQDARKAERRQTRILMVAQWVIETFENPEDAPQTLEFQIKQLKEAISNTDEA